MQTFIQSASLVELGIIGLLVYIIGPSYTLILFSLLNIIFDPNRYSLMFLINTLAIYIFGYNVTILSNLVVFSYYICYNYDTVVQYHKMLKELHNISKFAVDSKFKIEELETLTTIVEKADKVKIYIDRSNGTIDKIKKYMSGRFYLFSKSLFGKQILIIRSYLNKIGRDILITIKYIVEQVYAPEFIGKKREEYLRYYKCIADTNWSDIPKGEPNGNIDDLLFDEHLIKQLSNIENPQTWQDLKNQKLPTPGEIQKLSQMSDMMQNFSNMVMKGGTLNIDMKTVDRKTRRLMNKGKKNKKN